MGSEDAEVQCQSQSISANVPCESVSSYGIATVPFVASVSVASNRSNSGTPVSVGTVMLAQSAASHTPPQNVAVQPSVAASPLPHVQVIQQPLQNQYLQHLYAPQQQHMFLPGNLTIQPAIQSIGATPGISLQLQGKAMENKNTPTIISAPMQSIGTFGSQNLIPAGSQLAGAKACISGQMLATSKSTAVIQGQSSFIPTTSANQTVVIGQLGVLSNPQSVLSHQAKAINDGSKGKSYLISQPATLHPKSPILPSSNVSAGQMIATSQLKQIPSTPHIITTQAPTMIASQAQILGSLQALGASLPPGLTWATPGSLHSPALFGQNPIFIRSQQSDMFIQSPPPQATIHALPVAAAPQIQQQQQSQQTLQQQQTQQQIQVQQIQQSVQSQPQLQQIQPSQTIQQTQQVQSSQIQQLHQVQQSQQQQVQHTQQQPQQIQPAQSPQIQLTQQQHLQQSQQQIQQSQQQQILQPQQPQIQQPQQQQIQQPQQQQIQQPHQQQIQQTQQQIQQTQQQIQQTQQQQIQQTQQQQIHQSQQQQIQQNQQQQSLQQQQIHQTQQLPPPQQVLPQIQPVQQPQQIQPSPVQSQPPQSIAPNPSSTTSQIVKVKTPSRPGSSVATQTSVSTSTAGANSTMTKSLGKHRSNRVLHVRTATTSGSNLQTATTQTQTQPPPSHKADAANQTKPAIPEVKLAATYNKILEPFKSATTESAFSPAIQESIDIDQPTELIESASIPDVAIVAPSPAVPLIDEDVQMDIEEAAVPTSSLKLPAQIPIEKVSPKRKEIEPDNIGIVMPMTDNIIRERQPQKAIVKPHVLTHVIEGFVIQEGSEPFPVTLPSYTISKDDDIDKQRETYNEIHNTDISSTVKKKEKIPKIRGGPIELAKCEFCGKLGPKAKFKRSKRFCSTSCAKRFNAGMSKRLAIILPEQETKAGEEIRKHRKKGSKKGGKSKKKKLGMKSKKSWKRTETSNYEDKQWSIAKEREIPEESIEEKVTAEQPDEIIDTEMEVEGDSNELAEEESCSPSALYEDVEQQKSTTSNKDFASKSPLKWTVIDVCDFIRDLPGCSDYADEFKSQEIDGQALLLLKEDHLMSLMSMKLGPALKVCARINVMRDEMNH